MTRTRIVTAARALLLLGVLGGVLSGRADAQVVYPAACPPGYYLDPAYGCLPLNYFYGPPTYVYPGVGFGFFYGGRWDHWHDGRGGPPPRGGVPRRR